MSSASCAKGFAGQLVDALNSIGSKAEIPDMGKPAINTRIGRMAGAFQTVIMTDGMPYAKKQKSYLTSRWYAVVYVTTASPDYPAGGWADPEPEGPDPSENVPVLLRWFRSRRRARVSGKRFLRKNITRITACYVVRSCRGLKKRTEPLTTVETLFEHGAKHRSVIERVRYLRAPNRAKRRHQRRYWKVIFKEKKKR